MPACYVWKCDCGIEWKTFHSDDKPKQMHVCMCKQRHEVTGVITHLFYSPNPTLEINQDGTQVAPLGSKNVCLKSDVFQTSRC
jgi:hypothetical protein